MKLRWPKPYKEFNVPLYGGRIYIFRNKAHVVLAREYLKLATRADSHSSMCEHLVNNKTGESIYLIGWYGDKRSTLCHELAHAALFILDYAGIDVRQSAGEAYCYLLADFLEKAGIDK